MSRLPRPRLALMRPLPVLITESTDEFSRLHDKLKDDFRPHGAIEDFMVDEIAALMWEIRRYRRAKTTLINSAFRRALETLLERVCRQQEQFASELQENMEDLAYGWLGGDETAKRLILEALSYSGLNEDAIEAEAMRIMASDLEKFDRMLATREWRFERTLRSLAEFRGGLGRCLQASVERLIDGEVLAVGNASKQPRPAAA